MTILAVDSSREALDRLADILKNLKPEAEILPHTLSMDALAEARQREIDLAFIETNLPELNGIDLGRYLKDLYPMINLIFLTHDADYSLEAFSLHASGYIIKPATREGIEGELKDLRYPENVQHKKRAFAQTFGNFEFFIDGSPVEFKYTRTKEILALLINNRGAQTTNGEIIGSLWEDDGDPEKKSSYLGNLRQDLQNTLNKYKLNNIIIKQRGSMAIAVDKIECDLYDWLTNKKDSKYHYMGDYMNQYSWAEYVHAELDDISYAMEDE